MNEKLKKIAISALCLILIIPAFALVGCGGKEEEKGRRKAGLAEKCAAVRPRYAVSAFDRDAAVSAGVPHYRGLRREYADDTAGRRLSAPAEQYVLS